jgi:hypothetical protein
MASQRKQEWYVGFDVLTAVIRTNSAYQGVMPCSPLEVNRLLGEKRRLHFEGRRISQTASQHEVLENTVFLLAA